MAGLGAGQPMPQGMPPGAPPTPTLGGQQQATPEEQQLYERFVARCLMAVSDEKALPKILDMLRGNGLEKKAMPEAEDGEEMGEPPEDTPEDDTEDMAEGETEDGGGGEGDPIAGLAVTAATLVARVQDAAEAQGISIGADILLHGGAEVFSSLAELSTAAGIHDFMQDKPGLEAAWYRALDEFRVMRQSAGKIDQNVMKQDLAALQQADQNGSLAQFLGGQQQPRPMGA